MACEWWIHHVEMMKNDETGLKKPSTILCPYLSSKMGARIGQ